MHTLVSLRKEFQKSLFERVISKYGSSLKAQKFLEVPAASIRGYKNGYFKLIKKSLVDKLISLKILSEEELKKNQIELVCKEELIKKNLAAGREVKLEKLKNLQEDLPKISELILDRNILFQRWFNKYQLLLDCGFRKSYYHEEENKLIITYNNFVKSQNNQYSVKIPKTFVLDNDFAYFFGLWCGDSAGGKRMGIVNQNEKILDFTEMWLRKNHQITERILFVSELIKIPSVIYDKKFILKTDKKGWVISLHSNNGIFSSFFNFLYSHLDEFIPYLNLKSFFAGLFDAEGNVSLYNHTFRVACKDVTKVEIYSKYLRNLGFTMKYDGSNIVISDIGKFYHEILKFSIHNKKKELADFLINGKPVPLSFQDLINYILKNPGKTQKELSKALKKNKCSSELKLLCDFGYIVHKGYPYQYFHS